MRASKGTFFAFADKSVLLLSPVAGQGCVCCLKRFDTEECYLSNTAGVQPHSRRVCTKQFFHCEVGPACTQKFCSHGCLSEALGNNSPLDPGWHNLVCNARSNTMLDFFTYCTRTNETFWLASIALAKLICKVLAGTIASQSLLRKFFSRFDVSVTWSELAARSQMGNVVDYQVFVRRQKILYEQLTDAWRLLHAHFSNLLTQEQQSKVATLLTYDQYATLVAALHLYAHAIDSDHGSSPGKVVGIVLSSFENFQHSCVPNTQLDFSVLAPVEFGYVLLRDVQREKFTVTTIPLDECAREREETMMRKYGKVCNCPRCRWELGKSWMVNSKELVSLCLQAHEEGRFAESEIILYSLIRRNKSDADGFHLYGVTLLSQGQWELAHRIWRYAHELDRRHASLSKQASKDSAFVVSRSDTRLYSSLPYRALLHGEVFVTTAQPLPKAMCLNWIAKAESAAQTQGGWSTDRHQSVSTTDMPIHEIPEILEEWNDFFTDVLGPFLRDAFRIVRDIKVHDAFLVKYEAASGQTHLPDHTDESQFSLTLSLNDTTDFVGGGTTFPEYDLTVRPEGGDFVAFRSTALHRGARITAGIRYIVVAFLYTA